MELTKPVTDENDRKIDFEEFYRNGVPTGDIRCVNAGDCSTKHCEIRHFKGRYVDKGKATTIRRGAFERHVG